MPGVPDLLREIHGLRIHARELQAEIDRGPVVLKAHKNKAAKLDAAFAEAQDTLKKLKVSMHEREVSLKAANAQIAKYEKQTDEVKDMKQMEALRHQIAHGKANVAVLEEEILTTLGEIEEGTAKLPGLEQAAKKGKTDFAAFETEHKERLVMLARELKSALEKLVGVETQMPADVRPLYQRIVNAFGADSLAAITSKTCAHCNTQITSQQLIEAQGGEFVSCRSCGRGLYLSAPA